MSHIHVPDGVLPAWLWAAGWLATLAAVVLAARASERGDVRRRVPLLGVVSALMLVAMSSEIVPLAYHINLTVVAGVLLGPVLSVIAAFVVEVVLALLGHGGVTVLGLNTLLVAGEMIAGGAVFGALLRLLGRKRVGASAAAATVTTLALSTTLLVGIVALAGTGATAGRETGALDPASLTFRSPFGEGVYSIGLLRGPEGDAAGERGLSVSRFAAVVYTLGPLGWAIEAAVTAGVLRYVARVRPSLVLAGTRGARTALPSGHHEGR